MVKTFTDWLHEGEQLYDTAMAEYRSLEGQLVEIQQRLATKQTEVNQIAKVIGKSPIEAYPVVGAASPAVEVVEPGSPNAAPYTRNSIARALTGQPLRR